MNGTLRRYVIMRSRGAWDIHPSSPYPPYGEDLMSHIAHHVVSAVAFVPPGIPLDGTAFKECLAHIENRGYKLFSVLRDWEAALSVLRNHSAQVIVFAQQDHFNEHWEPRIEFVGEDTRRLVAGKPPRPTNAGPRRPRRAI
jgi:hypothetical protein